jgi:hypothetical protein
MNVFGLRGKIPGGVQGDEAGVMDCAHRWQQAGLLESLVQIVKEAEEVAGLHRVERLADLVVARDAPDPEQRPSIVAPLGLLHVLLKAQKRGALGEEGGEGRQRDVGHFKLSVVAGARIGQAGRDGAPALDEIIEAARVHAPRNAGTAPKVQVANA